MKVVMFPFSGNFEKSQALGEMLAGQAQAPPHPGHARKVRGEETRRQPKKFGSWTRAEKRRGKSLNQEQHRICNSSHDSAQTIEPRDVKKKWHQVLAKSLGNSKDSSSLYRFACHED